jgi:hypothetical protein
MFKWPTHRDESICESYWRDDYLWRTFRSKHRYGLTGPPFEPSSTYQLPSCISQGYLLRPENDSDRIVLISSQLAVLAYL